jgi:hypothetical protein
MPHSEPDNKEWVLEQIVSTVKPKTVLDVGAGDAVYADLIRAFIPNVNIYGIEIWEPYWDMFGLTQKYKGMLKIDVREFEDFDYDLVVFGDVLEHMTKEEAISVWGKAAAKAKWGIITIPIIHSPQEAAYGNPYEVHIKDDWSVEEVLESFSHIVDHKKFPITGAFLAKFDN